MMLIRESINGELDVAMNYKESKINLIESSLPVNTIDPNSIMVDIESIHEYPFNTRNYTRYHDNALLSSIPTWTKPYNRPVILHHNEKDGRIIGRVVNAFYKKDKTLSNTPALVLTINVPDEEAKKEIKNGILKTTSIGVLVHDCRCSICGQNIAEEGECEHERGERYDGQICYWDIYNMEAKELSYVIVPSDIYAQNVRIYNVNDNKKDIKEFNNMKGATTMSVSLKENSNTIIDENGDVSKTAATNIDYKAKFEELKKEYEEFKSSVDGDMVNANEGLKKELNNTKVLLSQAQKSLVDAENELTIKKADFLKEQSLRENLENDLEKCNKNLKESLLNNVLILRKSLNKPEIKKDSLIERSVDSLKDSILDLQEEMGINKTNSVNINESSSNKSTKSSNSIKEAAQASVPKNPSLVQENDKNKSVTESAKEDYDFDNEIQDIMKNLYN